MRFLVTLALCPTLALSQSVRGVVVDGGGTPMAGVVIQLLTPGDSVAGRALSNGRGEFLVATPQAGEYRVRTLRIGFKPVTSESMTLRSGEEMSRRFEIAGVAVALSGVMIEGESVCRRSADDSTGVAFTAWDQLRTAITATQITASSRGMTVTTIEYSRAFDPLGRTVLRDDATVRTEQVRQPWLERRPELLRKDGYVVEDQAGNMNYHVPGLDALSSTSFLEDHCLKLSPASDAARLGVSFEPNSDRHNTPEVRGVAWLDRATSELRSVDFSYLNLPPERQDLAGGRLEFTRMTDGTWVISRWNVRMPVLEQVAQNAAMGGVRLRIAELNETGAQLSLARRGTDTLWLRAPLPLSGTVIDSTTSKPIAGAVARLMGTSAADTTDARGRFSVMAVPGEYTLDIRTPSLDSVRAQHQTRVAFLDTASRHDVRVPDAAFIRRIMAARNSAVFTGQVLADSTNQPIRDVEVTLPDLKKTARTDSAGSFRIADVPEGLHRAVARRVGFGVYDAPVSFSAGRVVQRKILLPRVTELDAARVTADAAVSNLPLSFEENRKVGLGKFMNRDEIDRFAGMSAQTVLSQVTTVRLLIGQNRQAWISTGRMPNPRMKCAEARRLNANVYCPEPYELARGMMPACYAQVYIDRMLMNPEKPTMPFDVNTIPLQSIEAMEFYAGPAQTPPEYNRLNSSCGVLVVHTRR